jgi:hypothetical protein
MTRETRSTFAFATVSCRILRRAAVAGAGALVLGVQAADAAPTTIVFVGSSVTWGYTEVEDFGVGTVTDLNGCTQTVGGCKAIGGVPALFKSFAGQVGLDYDVYLEMIPGSSLTQHYDTERAVLDRAWDKVVMNGQTTLDFAAPGDPMRITSDVNLLGKMWQAHNPKVQVNLLSTWSRADLVYATPGNPWYGTPIYQMAKHVQAGYEFAAVANPTILTNVIPVGLAWNRAMDDGIADPNPYDGIAPGKVDLWRSGIPPESSNNYHASRFGSYLEALVVFGSVTGVDPLRLGSHEKAAAALAIAPSQAHDLQEVASKQLRETAQAERAAKEASVTAGSSRD